MCHSAILTIILKTCQSSSLEPILTRRNRAKNGDGHIIHFAGCDNKVSLEIKETAMTMRRLGLIGGHPQLAENSLRFTKLSSSFSQNQLIITFSLRRIWRDKEISTVERYELLTATVKQTQRCRWVRNIRDWSFFFFGKNYISAF